MNALRYKSPQSCINSLTFVALIAMSSPLWDRFMRCHIAFSRCTLKQAGLSRGASLRKLVTGKHVEITKSSKISHAVSINGVAITAPDLLSHYHIRVLISHYHIQYAKYQIIKNYKNSPNTTWFFSEVQQPLRHTIFLVG